MASVISPPLGPLLFALPGYTELFGGDGTTGDSAGAEYVYSGLYRRLPRSAVLGARPQFRRGRIGTTFRLFSTFGGHNDPLWGVYVEKTNAMGVVCGISSLNRTGERAPSAVGFKITEEGS